MTDAVDMVNVVNEPGLYAVRSGSGSVYYVDSRDPDAPRYLRAHGRGLTMASHMDDVWHPLVRLMPVFDVDGVEVLADMPWTLIAGKQHYYETRRPGHPRGDLYWVVSRESWEIERLNELPPPDDLTIDEREVWL